jgi:regulator of replication initiation timing
MAVKTYSYARDKNIKLSANFTVGEFRCHDNKTDTILIDSDLIPKMQQIRDFFNCSKDRVESGYRTPAWDKHVGGSGSGYHTKGQASDNYYYYKDGKNVPAKYICCYAQDIGVNGIGYINSTGVHLDTRSSKRYFDESKGNKNFADCYSYFGVSKTEIYGELATAVERDESKNQIEVLATELRTRRSNSTSSIVMQVTKKGQIYDFYEVSTNENYTWYRIGNNEWIADNGNYLKLLLPESEEEMEELKKQVEQLTQENALLKENNNKLQAENLELQDEITKEKTYKYSHVIEKTGRYIKTIEEGDTLIIKD